MKTNQKTSKHSNSEKGNIVNDDWIIQACFKAEEYRREQARIQAKKLLPWVMLIHIR